MAEEISIIHEHALFFDEILDCIPASLYLQPTEEENNRWKKYLKKNGNADKIQEMKENALKKRKEKFNPENDTTMVDKISERTKKEAEMAEEVVPPAVPAPATEPAKSLDELRERLNAKIEMLRKNRIEAAKRNDQKQRNKRSGSASKTESKEKRVKTTSVEKNPVPVEVTAPSVADVISNIQFGKIKTQKEVDTSLRPKARKDIHTLLKQAQRKQERLKEMKSTEAGRKEALNLEMDDALRKVEGIKKKDNPAKLRKTLKQQQQKKKKSQEEWKERMNAEKKRQKEKANKHRPGFEGKKKGFLNKKAN